MNFSIYVLGEVGSFVAALNSVAMVLGSTDFLGGAALLGALVGLTAFLIFLVNKEAGQQLIQGGSPIVGLLVFWVFVSSINIKTKVEITDVYTGNTSVVDNVPALLSMPASAISTAAYKIFDFSNTAFQGVDGSFMALGETGYVMPLQILNSLRQGMESVDPLLAASTKQFIVDCVPGGTVNPESLAAAPDALDYIFTNARDNGLTTAFTAAAPSGTSTSCVQAKASLAARSNDLLHTADSNLGGATKLEALVNTNVKSKNPNAGPIDGAMITDSVNRLILNSMTGSARQNADQFMLNVLFYNTMTSTFNCIDKSASQDAFSSCDVMMTQAAEQWKTDSAASASLFAKTMMPAMVFMQLMFYSLAPIVIIFGLLRGAGAIGMYVKFLGFGVWTASWLPVAAVIQMYIQNNVAGKVAQITARAVTPGNLKSVYYDVISTNLAIASDMLAATPLVTATILGISGMAISQLANNMGGKDRVDEKLATPDLMKNSPLAQRTSMAEQNANTGVVTQTGTPPLMMTHRAANSSAMASANATREADQKSIGADLSKGLNAAETRMLSTLNSVGAVRTEGDSVGFRTTDGHTISFGNAASSTAAQQALAKAAVSSQAGMEIGASIKAAIVPGMLKALAAGGSKVKDAAGAEALLSGAAKDLATKDASFMSRLARGDEDAVGTLIDTAMTAGMIGATVVGTATTGVGGAAAGLAVRGAAIAGRGAMIAGATKAIRGISSALEKGGTIATMTSAIFDNTQAGAKANMSAAISAAKELSGTTAEQQQQMASDMTNWTRGDYVGHDVTNSKTRGTQRSDQSQRSTAAMISETFKAAEQRIQSSDQTYQRNAQQALDAGVAWSGSAADFAALLRANPAMAADLRQRMAQMDGAIAGDVARARMLIDNQIKGGMTEDERNLAAGAMALSAVDKSFNLVSGRDPSGLNADSNAGLPAPNIGDRISQAQREVPAAGTIVPQPVAATSAIGGTAYTQAPVMPAQPAPQPAAPRHTAPVAAGAGSPAVRPVTAHAAPKHAAPAVPAAPAAPSMQELRDRHVQHRTDPAGMAQLVNKDGPAAAGPQTPDIQKLNITDPMKQVLSSESGQTIATTVAAVTAVNALSGLGAGGRRGGGGAGGAGGPGGAGGAGGSGGAPQAPGTPGQAHSGGGGSNPPPASRPGRKVPALFKRK
ncbi:conjugal transfer protein TraG N-terminal domain-containing protein [Methylibium petroleiphilum]|uniref:TraG N-terminal Proteobacteria domain-containing protein n=1 Tax=Methylibium petroleiphilum (strain ATCC BAA-1232 / LMG 22953 / PM1) TaxID=420662 RepID=A2SNL2_METPP|nr:conjugal transfer protein TraG N-terminal domain-containing protein [Methylibium petroleiphilum]ABM97151.1 hypothetical protein Mpe_B0376 [Methylibium petroleiphilum PM1]